MVKFYENGYLIIQDINSNNINKKIIDDKIKVAIFSGGCFWCIADPFYNMDGVIDVLSGYSGGNTYAHSYKEVKSGNTGHKEAILIIYDSTIISYKQLIKTFFENIDPFDGEGQFIDRGSSYQTAVYTNDNEEINCYKEIINYIEIKYNKKVLVPLLDVSTFYLAEEEHQRFSLKNKELFEKEEKISGRNSFDKIKIE